MIHMNTQDNCITSSLEYQAPLKEQAQFQSYLDLSKGRSS